MILVTGGAGYIGSHTLHRLKELGIPAIALDNLYSGHRWAVPEGTELVVGDISDQALVSGLIRKHRIESVIHFAAFLSVEESVQDPAKYYRNNVVGSLNLIEACIQNGVRNFIFSSTCAVYGSPNDNPIHEEFPIAPLSPYARTKWITESILRDLEASGVSSMKSVVLRYFNVAGAKVGGGLGQATPNAWQLVKVASEVASGKRSKLFVFGTDYPTKDGTCVRDYIHVDDLSEAHILALGYLQKGGVSQTLNCGYGKGYSVREVVETMKKVTGVNFAVEDKPPRVGDTTAVWADTTKLQGLLGWAPKCDDLALICRTSYEWEKSYKA